MRKAGTLMLKNVIGSLAIAALALSAGCATTPEATGSSIQEKDGSQAGRLKLAVSSAATRTGDTTATGLPLDAPWKKQAYAFAVQNLNHPSWGLAHAERNLQNALALAAQDAMEVDRDVLFAAAYMHDLGGLAGFEKKGVDHAVRSAELAEPLLKSWGFPMKKWPKVKDVILGHVYYGATPPTGPEAQVFHDADLLDFLGTMGIVRLVAATNELGQKPTLADPLKAARKFQTDLPGKLVTKAAREQAKIRVSEMKAFFETLEPYTLGGNAL